MTRQRLKRRCKAAQAVDDRPSLICCKTVIGKGAPHRAGTAKAHGEALGAEEVAATRAALGWNSPAFEIPQSVYADWDRRQAGGEGAASMGRAIRRLCVGASGARA